MSSGVDDELGSDGWEKMIGEGEGEGDGGGEGASAIYSDVVDAVAARLDLSLTSAQSMVEKATKNGTLAIDGSGTWDRLYVPGAVSNGNGNGTDTESEIDEDDPSEDDIDESDESGDEGHITDDRFPNTTEAVREHYRRLRPVYEALADTDGHPTTCVPSNRYWYHYDRAHTLDFDELEAGYRVARRAYTLERDFDEVVGRIEVDPDEPAARTLYTVTSQKDRDTTYERAFAASYDDYESGDGLASYDDMRALPFWADVDLADDVKPRRGELAEDELETIEAVFGMIIDEIAAVYGPRITADDVGAFDSGGGLYPWGPAATTLPIAEHLADDTGPYVDARAFVFKELADRMNAYLQGDAQYYSTDGGGTADADGHGFEGIIPRVVKAIPEAGELLDADGVLNTNRQTKALGSIHKHHDVVVTPLRDADGEVDYTPTLVSEVTDEVIERTRIEAELITGVTDDVTAEETVNSLIGTLFPEYAGLIEIDGGGWRTALETAVADERERLRSKAHETARGELKQRRRRQQTREDLEDELGREVSDDEVSAAISSTVTPIEKDVYDAVNAIDVRDVICDHACKEWDTSNRKSETTFHPTWRSSGGGKSCYVKHDDHTVFGDNACNGGGNADKAYALGKEIIPPGEHAAAHDMTPEQRGRAIDGLRRDGHEIPVYVPEKGATNSRGDPYRQTPLWALRKAAVALGILTPDEFVERESSFEDGETYETFPDASSYNATLEALDDEGIDHGREPRAEWTRTPDTQGSDADGFTNVRPPEPGRVATIPFERIATLNTDEARRLLKKRGVEWPTTADARERLRNRLFQAFHDHEKVVVAAPTAMGKSHLTATTYWLRHITVTGDAPVIQLAPTKDAREENIAASNEAGVSYAALKGRKDRCPVARGDHDPAERADRDDPGIVLTLDGTPASEWIDHQCDHKDNPFQLAHSWLAGHNDQGIELPCSEGDVECPAMTQWDGVPRDDDGNPSVDVVHATHHFAYVPSLRAHTNVVIDEACNAFSIDVGPLGDITQDRIRRAITAYLQAIDAPAKTFEGLVTLADTDAYTGDIGREREALEDMLDKKPDREWYIKNPDSHALAPDLARAIYRAIRWEEPDANGRRSARVIHQPPRFDEDQTKGLGGNFLTVVLDDEYTVRSIRHAPDFSRVRSVVGLDAHPTEPIWQRNIGPSATVDQLLDPTERRLWRRFERGLTVIQVGDATRPRSGKDAPEWDKSDTKLDVLIRTLRARHGDGFRTGITASAVERAFQARYEDAGIDDAETMHYGEEMSRNDFGGEDVGLINGCIDPGDDYVIDLLAELELDAHPTRYDPDDLEDPTKAICPDCGGSGGACCSGTGLERAKGREFDGPDADVAAELLASVRENHVVQAAGRYARSAEDPDDTATVYVRTDAIPAGFADVKVNGVEWVATDIQRDIITQLADRSSWASAKGLAEDVECDRSHVRKTLSRLEERGVVEREKGAGPNPDLWHATIDTLGEIDHIDLLDRPDEPTDDDDSSPSLSIATKMGITGRYLDRFDPDDRDPDPPDGPPPDRTVPGAGIAAKTVGPPSKRADTERTVSDGDNGEKARTGTYYSIVCGRPSFSSEYGR